MPSRSAANGLQAVGETTRMESHARRKPKVSAASYPPAIAATACPLRTIWNARPMAWVPDAQAVEMLSTGPVTPVSMAIELAPELDIVRRIAVGETRALRV